MEGNNQPQFPQPKKTNDWAIVSLVGGITGLTIFPFIGSLFGVIGGSIAKRRIVESQGAETGEDMARWGTILGWIGIGLTLLAACALLVFILFFAGWFSG